MCVPDRAAAVVCERLQTTKFLRERRLPGAPCSVPRHQLQQSLSPFPLYGKWCGLPHRVSTTTPTYLRNSWRCSQPSITVLEKSIIMTSAHWKRNDSSTPLPRHTRFLTNSIFCETVRLIFSQRHQGSPKCLQALSVLHKQPNRLYGFAQFKKISIWPGQIDRCVTAGNLLKRDTLTCTDATKLFNYQPVTHPCTELGYTLNLRLYAHYSPPLLTKMYFHRNTTSPERRSNVAQTWWNKPAVFKFDLK